jgi:hypothetical protein
MYKVIALTLAILSFNAFGVGEPNPCPSKVEGTEFGFKMDEDSYSITSEFDGDLYYISISLPTKYHARKLDAINLHKNIDGKVVLATGIAKAASNGFTKASFMVAPSELPSSSINAVYFSYYECRGKLVWDSMRGYDLPLNITRP